MKWIMRKYDYGQRSKNDEEKQAVHTIFRYFAMVNNIDQGVVISDDNVIDSPTTKVTIIYIK
ncbi:hypothetical protein [Paenibacillus endoradicis]|uniref:hypothetical protein n=1 Tax=Paenibacillus endoradicis TaxID=2972487 RepID=UPI0021598BCA|nr:hypothetical protein [Paenibacillus endoradicis]MCR8659159.1 hypothetical protein [Paenibacillus endoradicis]